MAYLFIATVSLVLGLVSGYLMHRSDFCVTGMFRDLFLFRATFMLRMLVLLVVLSMAAFEGLRLLGLLQPYPFPLLGPPSLSNLLGGMLFGVGMVLAGGCVVGSLYKAGAGRTLSLLALSGMVVGATAYAWIHPWWSGIAKATRLPTGQLTLPQAMKLEPYWLIGPLLLLAVPVLVRWFRRGEMVRGAGAEGYIQPWKTAVALAVIGSLSYLLVGMPLGITTSYSKWGATLLNGLNPEILAGLSYFQAEPLHYQAPYTGGLIRGGAGPALDGVAAIQYPLILGIVGGAFVSARRLGEFRPRFKLPPRQLASALIGGVVLGLAARMVPACNVWHLWGGLPILAMQSLLFLAGMLPGAWLGSRMLQRYVLAV